MWQSFILLIIAIWLIIVPFFGAMWAFYGWNNFIAGIYIVIMGVVLSVSRLVWLSAWAMLLGIWMVISSFIPALRHGVGVYWNEITTGIVLGIGALAGIIVSYLQMSAQRRES